MLIVPDEVDEQKTSEHKKEANSAQSMVIHLREFT